MYNLTVTETQLRLIWRTLEYYERAMMGQFEDFTDELSVHGLNREDGYFVDGKVDKTLFDTYIERRNAARAYMNSGYHVACPSVSMKSRDMMIAEDMWVQIRHVLWKEKPEPKYHDTVESREPFGWGGEPIIEIRRAGGTPSNVASLERENAFLKAMQRQLTVGIPKEQLGLMVMKARAEVGYGY